MVTAGKVLFWIGLIGGGVLVVACIVIAVLNGRNLAQVRDSLQPVGSSTTVQSDGSQEIAVYVDTRDATVVQDACTVDGPSGAAAYNPIVSGNIQVGSTQWYSVGTYSLSQSGTYTVQCSTASGQQFMVGQPVSVTSIFGLVGAILIGVFGGGFFVLLGLLGLILWLVGRNKRKKMQPAPGMYPPSQPHPGF